MYRIKTVNKISPRGLAYLDKDRFEIGDALEQENGILVRSGELHDYAMPESLLAIARAGAGVNNIPLDRCAEAGIVVFNTPGANANAVKELAICALLLSSRNVAGGISWVHREHEKGADIPKVVEKGKSAFLGPEIMGKTLGVVGLGAIGVLVANAAIDLGMDVVGYDPFLSVQAALSLNPKIKHVQDLPKVYQVADYITLHLPTTKDTKGFINQDAIAQMKDGVRIINLARGDLVTNPDIIAALDNGKVSCYATDFPDSTLPGIDNVITIPHLGASTPESEENCAVMACRQMQDYLDSGNIINSVNLPNLSQEWLTNGRICLLHKNDHDFLGKVTAALTQKGIAYTAMSSKSKGDYAYSILDVEEAPGDDVAKDLSAIAGVIRARILKR